MSAAEIIDVDQIDDDIESVESADLCAPVSNQLGDAEDDPIVCDSDDEAAAPQQKPPPQPQQRSQPAPQPSLEPALKKARTSHAGGSRRAAMRRMRRRGRRARNGEVRNCYYRFR